eukprot:GHUV01005288.1.p1 GENE.GHUV01005288.1~~GHUV01005288.1.p1  ORF type:complete len:236 (+),score=37.94 GHUV01005288.1:223-930(+)
MSCLQQTTQQRPFTSSRPHCPPRVPSLRTRCVHQQHRCSEPVSAVAISRRSLLSMSQSAALLLAAFSSVPVAHANPLEDVARQLTRPEITPLEAAVALLDARSTLRDMQSLVGSSPDSRDRFNGRKLWPAYAKWLRPVGPSAPVAAAVIAGSDVESTLSAQYGGTGDGNAEVDAVYVALGKVLTISGRTIRDEAQVDVQLAKDAEVAIDAVINKLPTDLVNQAQQFRIARANGRQ